MHRFPVSRKSESIPTPCVFGIAHKSRDGVLLGRNRRWGIPVKEGNRMGGILNGRTSSSLSNGASNFTEYPVIGGGKGGGVGTEGDVCDVVIL